MANMINLNLNSNNIPINFGAFTLEYNASDEREGILLEKAKELEVKAKEFQEVEDNYSDPEQRKIVKEMIDDFFASMFDADGANRIYEACGSNTWSYLNAFMQITTELRKIKEEQANDENFKQYLAE